MSHATAGLRFVGNVFREKQKLDICAEGTNAVHVGDIAGGDEENSDSRVRGVSFEREARRVGIGIGIGRCTVDSMVVETLDLGRGIRGRIDRRQ